MNLLLSEYPTIRLQQNSYAKNRLMLSYRLLSYQKLKSASCFAIQLVSLSTPVRRNTRWAKAASLQSALWNLSSSELYGVLLQLLLISNRECRYSEWLYAVTQRRWMRTRRTLGPPGIEAENGVVVVAVHHWNKLQGSGAYKRVGIRDRESPWERDMGKEEGDTGHSDFVVAQLLL